MQKTIQATSQVPETDSSGILIIIIIHSILLNSMQSKRYFKVKNVIEGQISLLSGRITYHPAVDTVSVHVSLHLLLLELQMRYFFFDAAVVSLKQTYNHTKRGWKQYELSDQFQYNISVLAFVCWLFIRCYNKCYLYYINRLSSYC